MRGTAYGPGPDAYPSGESPRSTSVVRRKVWHWGSLEALRRATRGGSRERAMCSTRLKIWASESQNSESPHPADQADGMLASTTATDHELFNKSAILLGPDSGHVFEKFVSFSANSA